MRLKHRTWMTARPSAPSWISYLIPLLIFIAGFVLLQSNDASINVTTNINASLNKLKDHHPEIDPPSYIPYHTLYARLPPALGIALLVLWLVFLFSFLGIVASDFFCPNLSTLASRLGLPEDVAGATLVGWANGAPDLFSTFASLKAGSGSLAIGELIGAASFICSVVAGSMVLVKPFKVGKYNFFRDVGFFTVAVAFAMAILRDGQIHKWEAGTMIALYATYVVLVAGGSWWRRRRRRMKERQRLIRGAWRNDNTDLLDEHHHTDVSDTSVLLDTGDAASARNHKHISTKPASSKTLTPLIIPSFKISGETEEGDYFSKLAPSSEQVDYLSPLSTPSMSAGVRKRSGTLIPTSASVRRYQHGHVRSHSHTTVRPTPGRLLHRSSILAAIEFRDVVNSLQVESTASRHLSPFREAGDADADVDTQRHQRRPISSPESNRRWRRQVTTTSPRHETGIHNLPRAMSNPGPESARVISELAVEDPWKNAPVPKSRIGMPSLNVEDAAGIPEWNLDSSLVDSTSGYVGRDTGNRESTTDGSGENFMSRYPAKALKLLGLAKSSNDTQDGQIPPKAQRLLGLHVPSPAIPDWSRSWRIAISVIIALIHAIFPSLHNFRSKSILAMITSVISVPAVLLLNLTLPVVDETELAEEFLQEMEKERLISEDPGHRRGDGEEGDDDDDDDVGSHALNEDEDSIEEELNEEERVEYENNVRRSLAIAHELHSPVATLQHPHSHHLGRTGVGAMNLAPPDVEDGTFSVSQRSAVPSLPELEDHQELRVGQTYEITDLELSTYLTAIQCFLAPIFVVMALLGTIVLLGQCCRY